MAATRRGFDVPYGAATAQDGQPTQPMSEWMDKIADALNRLKAAADAMDDLDPATATTNQIATAWEELRTALQAIE